MVVEVTIWGGFFLELGELPLLFEFTKFFVLFNSYVLEKSFFVGH